MEGKVTFDKYRLVVVVRSRCNPRTIKASLLLTNGRINLGSILVPFNQREPTGYPQNASQLTY